jgi:hypothetical protein
LNATVRSSDAARPGWALPALAFAALVVAAYATPLFVRRNFSGRDLIAYNLPMEKSIHDAYARGRLPIWSPNVSGGRPLAPNPNAGALYPVRAAFAPLRFPLSAKLFPVLHWVLSGIGVLLLARTMGRSRAAAWVGAVTYSFSGVGVSEVFFPHIHPGMTLLPWIVWATARPARVPWRRMLPLGCLFGLDFLAGDVFTGGLAIGSAALWIFLESDREARGREIGALVASAGLGALVAAPQIAATALWIPYTNRAVLGMKLSDAIYFSIHPLRLIELVVPYPFGAAWDMTTGSLWGWPLFHGRSIGIFNTLYCGAFAFVAAVAAWRSRERGARFGRVLLVVALAVSVLPSVLPTAWAGSISSPLPLRNPEKLAVAIVLALSILAAIGLDRLRSSRTVPRWTLVAGGLLAAAALAATLAPDATARFVVHGIGADAATALPRARASLALGYSEAGLLWMATVVALALLSRGTRPWLAGALVLLTAVPIEANRKIARSFREDAVFGPTAFARYVAREDPQCAYRTLGEVLFRPPSALGTAAEDSTLLYSDFSRRSWTQHTPVLWNRGTVINEDFDVGDLSRVESLRKIAGMASGYTDSGALFGSLALRFGIRWSDQDPIAGYHRVGGDALQSWDEHAHAYPDVRLLERWSEVDGPLTALQALPRLSEGGAVLESGRSGRGAARPGTVRLLEKSPERMRVELDLPDPGWLFVLRAYWPYRRIRLDGNPIEAVPAQLAFSAVSVPAGRHQLVWEEQVPGLEASAWGPVLFGAIAVGLAVTARRKAA